MRQNLNLSARNHNKQVKARGSESILQDRYRRNQVVANVPAKEIEYTIRKYEFVQIETVYKMLGHCCNLVSLAGLFSLFPYIQKGMLRGYIKFCLDKELIGLDYKIQSGHRVPYYGITAKGNELLDMLNVVYNILGV